MIDVPEEHLKTADAALHGIAFYSRSEYSSALLRVAYALTKATAVERERCARLARSFELASDNKFDSCVSRARNGKRNLELAAATAAGMAHAARKIAAAICAGGNSP